VRITTDPDEAARALAEARVVAIPTETVYGLAALADSPSAVARVYVAKGRPADHPLIVHLSRADAVSTWVSETPPYAQALAESFWPGPLTLVLPRSDRAKDYVTGTQNTVALRVPGNGLTREVIRRVGEILGDPDVGVAAPSANLFGKVSPTCAQDVVTELGELLDDELVLDGGPCTVGVESTIVDCSGDRPIILRPGQIGREDIEAGTGLLCGERSEVRAPGTLAAHYSPATRVHLSDADSLPGESKSAGLIALASIPTPAGMVRLTAPDTAAHYAASLYRALREADALHLDIVYAIPPEGDGIEAAIRDRLERASHETT
jgi:L-threonylcarbamoyladenylate synthase